VNEADFFWSVFVVRFKFMNVGFGLRGSHENNKKTKKEKNWASVLLSFQEFISTGKKL
jgi:hypothetical protein